MRAEPVEVSLDVRGLRDPLKGPQDLLEAWNTSVLQIFGRTLRTGDTGQLSLRDRGALSYVVIGLQEPVVVTDDTPFSVHSLIEPSPANPPCRECAAVGQSRPGFFRCELCRTLSPSTGLCYDHAHLIGNAFQKGRVIATCAEHVPKCNCGQEAVFWCVGPACHGRHAWCSRHRIQHPNSREIYCPGCYEQVYPACSLANCTEVAHNVCEHVDPTRGEECGRRVCNVHVARWQVFGYEKIGLARCQMHRAVRSLSDLEVAWQVVAGTALRHERGAENRYHLPTLASLKNILLKARRQQYSAQSVLVFFLQVEDQLKSVRQQSNLHKRMLRLISREKPRWIEQGEKERDELSAGAQILERLKSILRANNLTELADSVQMTDYRPRFIKGPPPKPALFVRLPDHMRPRFIGRQGVTIKNLSQQLGVELKLEQLK